MPVEFSLKTALRLPHVYGIEEVKSSSDYACLKLFDKDNNFIGFTRPYKKQKLFKASIRWLFRDFRCVQCKHIFSSFVLAEHFLKHPHIKTITCPVCGVENLRCV